MLIEYLYKTIYFAKLIRKNDPISVQIAIQNLWSQDNMMNMSGHIYLSQINEKSLTVKSGVMKNINAGWLMNLSRDTSDFLIIVVSKANVHQVIN